MANELAKHWEELVDLAGVVLIRVDRPADQPSIRQKVASVALDVTGSIGVEGTHFVSLPGTEA